MAQLCDFTNEYGIVPTQDDVTAALTEASRGNLPQSDADRISEAFENGEVVEPCAELTDVCDFVDSDGVRLSLQHARWALQQWRQGVFNGTREDVERILTAAEGSNGPIERCISQPDESEVSVSLDSLRSPSPGEVEVTFTVTNTVTSGDGASDSSNVTVTLDGSVAGSEPYSVGPGESQTFTRSFGGLSEGSQYNVCVEI